MRTNEKEDVKPEKPENCKLCIVDMVEKLDSQFGLLYSM